MNLKEVFTTKINWVMTSLTVLSFALLGNRAINSTIPTATTFVATCTGNADAVDPSSIGIEYNTNNESAVLDGSDNDYAQVYDLGDRLVLDLSDVIFSGEVYTITWRRKTTYTDVVNADIVIEESSDKLSWTENPVQPSSSSQTFITTNLTTSIDTRYLRIRTLTASGDDVDIDAISYSNVNCCTRTPSYNNVNSTEGTCNGNTPNNDASISVTGIVDADRAGISSTDANSYDGVDYAGATNISGSSITFTGLNHGATYIIRLFDGVDGCPIDISVTSENPPASCPILPSDLPWTGSTCNGKDIILQPGIAILTCSVTEEISNPDERWTFGLVNMENAIPASGRVDQSANQGMYHHPDWTIDKIGNVFGIAINNKTGNFYVAASSNYGSGFGVAVRQTGILQYGSIGGGSNNLQAAGTVYKIDGTSGVPTVFAVLPQQSISFTAHDCENGTTQNRTTGVGLGNIVYDEVHNQYFVSNIEDGRIYRLGADGGILDSFDPFTEDDGVAGISILEEVPYGLAVEPSGNRLFFGVIDAPMAGGTRNPGAGSPGIYSINLSPAGGFIGLIDNDVMPSGATYNNYTGTETLHTTIATGINADNNTYTQNTVYLISDLHFTSDDKLLVGVRVSCQNSFFASYNHWGETNVLTANALGIYNNNLGTHDISVSGDAGPEDNYGGVASYDLQDGSGDIHYLITSADIIEEAGPHGVAIYDQNASFTAPVSPLGVVSYGTVDNGDPKGVGGDVEVFSACVPKGILAASATQSCNDNSTPSNENDDYIIFSFTATNTDGGISNQYEVVLNGTVLTTATYGNTVTLEYSNTGQTERFLADGTSVYYFVIQDVNDAECYDNYNSTPVVECSECPAEICMPVGITINRS